MSLHGRLLPAGPPSRPRVEGLPGTGHDPFPIAAEQIAELSPGTRTIELQLVDGETRTANQLLVEEDAEDEEEEGNEGRES